MGVEMISRDMDFPAQLAAICHEHNAPRLIVIRDAVARMDLAPVAISLIDAHA